MNSLYDQYRDLTATADKWLYYTSLQNNFHLDTVFLENNSKFFIESYFSAGGKLKAFEWMRHNELFDILNDRANHAVSAFLLGIFLRDSLHMDMRKGLPKLESRDTKNFLYFWSLTCLYHDISYNLENNSNAFIKSCGNIDDFIQYFHIDYNLLNAVKDPKMSALIRNYYLYRAGKGIIDHGVTGAMLFYDGLMKTFNIAKSDSTEKANGGFQYEGLSFSRDFPKHICFIAENIARHNMWRSKPETVDEYKKFNLNELIPNANNDHIISFAEENNLLFLLGLIDTVEPLKCFGKNGSNDPYNILRSLSCAVNYRKFEISFSSNLPAFGAYRDTIKKLKDWMDVCITESIDTIKITINRKEEEEDVA